MKHKIAKIISFVLHPVIFALLLPFLVIYYSTGNFFYGLKWTIFSFGFLLLTLIVFFFVEPVTFLTDFDITRREKRPIFYTISLLFAVTFFIVAVVFKGIFFSLSIVALGIIVGLVVFEFVNFFLKVSIHVAVASAYAITVGLLYGPVAFAFVFWMPLAVFWSRLILKKHTKEEAIAGLILGPLVTIVTFAIGRILL